MSPSDQGADGAAAVAELVDVVDRLRSPGGCPWDAAQTHLTLAPYCIEEAYEVAAAIEGGDAAALPDELGDLLLQVVIHCRVSSDEDDHPFTLGDVARGEVAKLTRRHPHVFGADADGERPQTPSDSHQLWDRVKGAEPGRTSAFDGIPLAQGALARAGKLLSRAERAGLLPPSEAATRTTADDGTTAASGPASDIPLVSSDIDPLALSALELTRQALAKGLDLEAEVRRATSDLEESLRHAEKKASRMPE